MGGFVQLIRSLPLRASRCEASLRLPKFVPDELMGPHPRRHRQKSQTPHSGRLAFLAERVSSVKVTT